MPFVLISSFILSAAYMNVRFFIETERHKNREVIWFIIAVIDIIGTIFAFKVYNLLVKGIDIEIAGAVSYILLGLGYGAMIIISAALISLLTRHGARNQGVGLVLMLDAIIAIVMLGLFLI